MGIGYIMNQMLIDTRDNKEYKEFNIGDYVMVCGHIGCYHELAKGKILHKQKNWFRTYDYIVENFANGMLADPTYFTILDCDENVFNEFKNLDDKIVELEKQEKELRKELHKIIPHRH